MNRKKRSDFTPKKLLNPEQQALLRTWLVDENMGYAEAKERLYQDFNVKLSVGALQRFYATDCFALRSSEAKEFAETCVQQLTDSGEKFDEATLALIKQKAFERAYARNGNIKELATLAKMIGDTLKLKLKEKDQKLAERRIAILEKKAAQADAASGVMNNPQLSEAERSARLKEIFRM